MCFKNHLGHGFSIQYFLFLKFCFQTNILGNASFYWKTVKICLINVTYKNYNTAQNNVQIKINAIAKFIKHIHISHFNGQH